MSLICLGRFLNIVLSCLEIFLVYCMTVSKVRSEYDN